MLRYVAGLLLFVFASAVDAQETESAPRKLVIGGGGALPNEVFKAFRQLAGEEPKLIVIPTASSIEPNTMEVVQLWNGRGFQDVEVLHTRVRAEANDKAFAGRLDRATAVWFGGGSQSKLAEAYESTLVETKLHELLARGGVIGGSSAGAAIQSEVMIAGGRTEPRIGVGLGFLPECILDQHFLARDRLRRSISAVREHSNKIGIGVDEGTALVVVGNQARVEGRSYVIRIESSDSGMEIRSFGEGETVPLVSP